MSQKLPATLMQDRHRTVSQREFCTMAKTLRRYDWNAARLTQGDREMLNSVRLSNFLHVGELYSTSAGWQLFLYCHSIHWNKLGPTCCCDRQTNRFFTPLLGNNSSSSSSWTFVVRGVWMPKVVSVEFVGLNVHRSSFGRLESLAGIDGRGI